MKHHWRVVLIAVFSALVTVHVPAQDTTNVTLDPGVATLGTNTVAGEQSTTEVVGSVTLTERLQSGGKTMLFLGLCSLAALTFSLERLFGLKRSAISPAGLTQDAMRLWEAKDYDGINSLCDQHPSTLATILKSFVRHRHCSSQELSQLAGDIAGRDMRMHLQRAYPIAIAATLSPLLGLLGTVIGMIESFEVVAIVGSMGDASVLAGSISKALVTTATGLIIAVPSLAMYHFFKSRTSSLTALLEGNVNEVLTTWFMENPELHKS